MKLSVRDLAKVFAVSENTVYRWAKQDGLPAHGVEQDLYFNRAQVLEWATVHKVPLKGDLFAEEVDAAPPNLADALAAGGIFHRVGGTEKDSVLRAVVELMKLPEGTDRQFLLQILLARESMGSTGIGEGIAIPHVRNPIVLDVPRSMISLCFLERPIEFGAIDGKPVHTLFTLISPTVRTHLHILSHLTYALREEGFRRALVGHGTQEQIISQLERVEQSLPSSYKSR